MAFTKDKKQAVIKDFGINAQDTGSAPVQVAILTQRINQVTEHLQKNKHDFSSKRGLLKMVARRKLFLKYLEENDKDLYAKTVKSLNLKK